MVTKVVLVEDERSVRETLLDALKAGGFDALAFDNGRSGLESIQKEPPDLVLLDVNTPGMSGVEVCRRLRKNPVTARLPVVMLTGLTSEADTLLGFNVGADDYVAKPWRAATLLARLNAVLRRAQPSASKATLTYGPFTLRPDLVVATAGDEQLLLTPSEFRLFQLFMSHPGRPMAHAELLEPLLEGGGLQELDNVRTFVGSLRKKLGERANWIQTVWGVGYRLQEP
jgi:DNA-binding response OmpR family regulator